MWLLVQNLEFSSFKKKDLLIFIYVLKIRKVQNDPETFSCGDEKSGEKLCKDLIRRRWAMLGRLFIIHDLCEIFNGGIPAI